jgi:3-(3-hydroxy-phenyl)propionate hydroxylase
VFRVADHEIEEEITAEASIRERMAKFLNIDIDFKIVQPQVYRVHQRVASTFRVGRVLLLGDAAHVNNPAGGMGLNSGIHDVYNLVAKLEAALAGASDDLLDRYSDERRAFSLENVQKRAHSNYQALGAKDEASRQARNQELQAKAAAPELARQHLLQFSMLGNRGCKIYRISELAKRVGKSPTTLRRWDNEGKLPAKRLPNGHRYYDASDERKALGIIA